ncbi:MAG: hypothetical protein IM536_10830 [Pseudanabaena sp. M34BS1SP1A06MG]|nr:hypothetical protein [Pseudanabaena sp. M34BS1SP1A06MG]
MAVSFSRTDCMCLVTEAEFCHVDLGNYYILKFYTKIPLQIEVQKKKLSYSDKS